MGVKESKKSVVCILLLVGCLYSVMAAEAGSTSIQKSEESEKIPVQQLIFPGRLFPLGGGASERFLQPVVVADINLDGAPDIVTIMHDDNKDGDYRSPDYLKKAHLYDVNVLLGSRVSPGVFSTPQTIGQIDSPTSFEVGDVNGDKIPDIIITREYANMNSPGPRQNTEENWDNHFRSYQSEIIVLMSKSSNQMTFSPKRVAQISGRMSAIQTGDLNGDGKLDIGVLVGDYSKYKRSIPDSVKTYVGVLFAKHKQKGKFKPLKRVFSSSGVSSLTLSIGDLNQDGFDDIVLTITNKQTLKPKGNMLKVLFAKASGDSFLEANETASMQVSPWFAQVRIHDMNQDGLNDLVIAGGNQMIGHAVFAPTSVNVWLADKKNLGQFLSPISINEGSDEKSIFFTFEIADINGDSYADVVVSSVTEKYKGGVVRYYLADKNNLGHFLLPQDVVGEPRQTMGRRGVVSLSDVTGDGIVDITTVVADSHRAYVSILEGRDKGERRFYAFQDYHVRNPFEEESSWTNLEGFPNLDVDWGRGVSLRLSSAQKKKKPFAIPFKWESRGDIKGKVQDTEWNQIQQLLSKVNRPSSEDFQGVMDPEKRHVSFDMGYYPGAVADFNGDGLLDYAEADSKEDDWNTVSVWLNDFYNPSTFLPFEKYKIDGISYTSTVKAGDLNHDGFDDVIVLGRCGEFAVLWGGRNASGKLSKPQYVAEGHCIKDVILKDLNNDGWTDLIAVGVESISMFLADSKHPKSFLEAQSFVLENPRNNELHISVDDLNGDGFVDILVSRSGRNNYMSTVTKSSTWIYWSDPNGTKSFKEAEFLQLDGVENKDRNIIFTVKDLNSDGRKDLIVESWSSLQLLLSNADDSFSYAKPALISQTASFIGVQDVNQDGYADLILKEGMGVAIALANPNVKGSFLPAQVFDVGGDGGVTSLLFMDLNADGKLDMVYDSWSIVMGGLVRVLLAK